MVQDILRRALRGEVLARQFDEAASASQARVAKRLLGVRKGQRVLDIPCGLGRLTVPLAKMGLEMTGLDFAEPYLGRARRAAQRAGVRARFVRGDMREIAFDGEFDGAVNWFTSFGYFSDAENVAFARRVLRALRPRGRFLVETMNKPFFLAHPVPRGATRTATGYRTVRQHGAVSVGEHYRWDARAGRIESAWTLRQGNRVERTRFLLKVYNGAELRTLLRQAGFRDIRLYGAARLRGDYCVGPLTRHSFRLIAVAVRPRE